MSSYVYSSKSGNKVSSVKNREKKQQKNRNKAIVLIRGHFSQKLQNGRVICVFPLVSSSRYNQHAQDKSRNYSWAQNAALDHNFSGTGGPLYGRLCYSSQTLPVLRRTPGGTFDQGLAELAYCFPGGQPDQSLVIQNQGAAVGPMESGAVYIAPMDLSKGSQTGSRAGSRDGTATLSGVSTSDGGTPRTGDYQEKGGGPASNCTEGSSEERCTNGQDMDWVRIIPEPMLLMNHLF